MRSVALCRQRRHHAPAGQHVHVRRDGRHPHRAARSDPGRFDGRPGALLVHGEHPARGGRRHRRRRARLHREHGRPPRLPPVRLQRPAARQRLGAARLPELPPDDGRHDRARRALPRHRQLGRRKRLQHRGAARALAQPARALRPGARAGHASRRRQRQPGLLRVHLGRRAVHRAERDDVHGELPSAGHQSRAPRRLDARRGAARVARARRWRTPPRNGASPSFITPSAATRATRSTPPTAAAAGAPPASASKRSCTTC